MQDSLSKVRRFTDMEIDVAVGGAVLSHSDLKDVLNAYDKKEESLTEIKGRMLKVLTMLSTLGWNVPQVSAIRKLIVSGGDL